MMLLRDESLPADLKNSKIGIGEPSKKVKDERKERFVKLLLDGLDISELAQAVRQAHCAGSTVHECTGMCIIRADGILLSCKQCGHEYEPKEQGDAYSRTT